MFRKHEPILVFAEHHTDPITVKILTKLSPELKARGYSSFLDEIPSSLTNSFKSYLENEENQYRALKEEFEGLHLNIQEPDDVYRYTQLLKEKITSHEKWSRETDIIVDNIEKHDVRIAYIRFLSQLSELDIKYRAIDVDTMQPKMPISQFEHLTQVRDIQMAQTYIRANEPAFGRIGLAHAEGIQNEIIQNLSIDEAKDRFQFFYIYSKELAAYSDILYFDKIQNGLINLPLDLMIIDATNLNEDQIVESIIKQLDQKKGLLEQHQSEREKHNMTQLQTKEKKVTDERTGLIDGQKMNQTTDDKEQNNNPQKAAVNPTLTSTFFKQPAEQEKKESFIAKWIKSKPFTF